MMRTMNKLTQGATRLLVLALGLGLVSTVWADTQVAYSWDNLAASGGHNQSSTKQAWSITLPATAASPSGSTVSITNLIFCSRNSTLSGTDPRYFKITVGTSDYTSEVLNGTGLFSGETVNTTGTVASYPKLQFKFTTPVPLVVGTQYTLTPLDENQTFTAGTTTLGAKLVQSYDANSAVVMGGQGSGYYPICIVQGYATVSTRIFTSAPASTVVNFSDLTWEEGGAAATLPSSGDYTDCIFEVTMPDGGVLTLDENISNLSGFIVEGASASLVFDTTKSYSVTTWDFSGLSGTITLDNFPSAPTAANPILPTGGVVFSGSTTLSADTVPYRTIDQGKPVTVSQNIVESSSSGLQFALSKSSYTLSGDNSISRLVLGNKNVSGDANPTQVITQNGGTITVTGDAGPSSTSAAVLLAHWGSTVTLNNYAGTFSALNAASRLGWDGSATWNVGRASGSDTATVKVKGIVTGQNGHTGSGTLNINAKGVLEVGSDGITMASNVGKINLAGGTVKATANMTIANTRSDWTVLNNGLTTTINTQDHDVEISAPLSGSGNLTKTGSGDLIITGTGTATGSVTINGGRVVLSGNEAKIGTSSFAIKGSGCSLDIVPGANNTINLAPQYLVGSTYGYDGAVDVNIGAGTVVYSYADNSNENGCFAGARVNILSGGTFELNYKDALGWNRSTAISIASGGKYVVSKRQTMTRKINLAGGTLEFSDSGTDGRGLDLFTYSGSGIEATADSTIQAALASGDSAVANPVIWIRNGDLPINVGNQSTLSFNACIAEGSSDAVGRGIVKTGAGTLAMNGFAGNGYTYTGKTTVNAGTLALNAAHTTGSEYEFASGTTLKLSDDATLTTTTLTLPSTGTVTLDVTDVTKPTGTSKKTLFTAQTGLDLTKISLTGASTDYYIAQDGTTGAVTIQLYVAKDSNGVYYTDLSSALGAIINDKSLVVTILDGTGASSSSAAIMSGLYWDSENNQYSFAVARVFNVETPATFTPYPSLATAVSAATEGQQVTLCKTSDEAVTLSGKTIVFVLNSGVSFTGSFAGNGTLKLNALTGVTSCWAEGWTGTVVLPADQTFGGQKFDDYGIAGSTVRLQGANTGWLDYGAANNTPSRAPVATTIEIPSGASLTVTGWSPSFANTFNVLKGSGTFAVNIASAIDISYSDYSAYFLLKDVSNFTGSLSATGAGIAIGASKPAYSTTGGKIILTTSATIATGKTWTATEGIVLADAAATLTNADGALDPAPTTTVANSYVKLTGSTYSVDTYKTVTFSGSNFSVAVTTNGQAVAVANNACTVEAGEISFTITPSSGYQVTAVTPSSGSVSGEGPYTYTVSGDVTITVTTAQESSVEIGAATFEYGVDFTNATVTVAVTETNASGVEYTLTVGAKDYTASAVGGTTVTFNNVEVPRGAAYGTVSYGITSTASATTGETSGSAAVADVQAGWINENATTHGLASAGGAWTNAEAVSYSEGKAAISDNRFAATTASTASRVVLEFEVCFSSTSEDDVSGEAQAAIKLGEVNSATTFMVLAPGNTWTPVSNAELPIDASATYKVVLAIDYGNNTYGVTVGNSIMTNNSGSTSFPLATSKATVQNIDFVGSGTLTSMKGDQIEGYMVVDKNGTRYASIAAAVTAYLADPTIAPLRVLHDGTAPSGWKIVTEGGVDILKKIAKGLFFMAY